MGERGSESSNSDILLIASIQVRRDDLPVGGMTDCRRLRIGQALRHAFLKRQRHSPPLPPQRFSCVYPATTFVGRPTESLDDTDELVTLPGISRANPRVRIANSIPTQHPRMKLI